MSSPSSFPLMAFVLLCAFTLKVASAVPSTSSKLVTALHADMNPQPGYIAMISRKATRRASLPKKCRRRYTGPTSLSFSQSGYTLEKCRLARHCREWRTCVDLQDFSKTCTTGAKECGCLGPFVETCTSCKDCSLYPRETCVSDKLTGEGICAGSAMVFKRFICEVGCPGRKRSRRNWEGNKWPRSCYGFVAFEL